MEVTQENISSQGADGVQITISETKVSSVWILYLNPEEEI